MGVMVKNKVARFLWTTVYIYIYKLHTCYLLIREFRYIVTLQANHNYTVQRQQRIPSV